MSDGLHTGRCSQFSFRLVKSKTRCEIICLSHPVPHKGGLKISETVQIQSHGVIPSCELVDNSIYPLGRGMKALTESTVSGKSKMLQRHLRSTRSRPVNHVHVSAFPSFPSMIYSQNLA